MTREAQARTGRAVPRVALIAVLLGCACAQPPRNPALPRLGAAPLGSAVQRGVGPRSLDVPARAVVARDARELHAMLADPNGPTELWLRGRYDGDFRVTRPLALRGATGAMLHGSGQGTVLSVEADGVTLENLVVRHSGVRHTSEDSAIKAKGRRIQIRDVRVEDALFGLTLGPCPGCVVERAQVLGPGERVQLKGDGIKLWESNDAVVRDCEVVGVRDVVVWYSRRVLLERNRVQHSRYGTHFMYAHDSIARDSRIENNVVGVFVMYSARLRVERNVLSGARGAAGVGLGFKESDGVEVEGNWLVANATGSYLDGTPRAEDAPVRFTNNTLSLNDVGLRLHGVRSGLHFEHNDFGANIVAVEVEGGGDARSASFLGNRYADYVGYDLDSNGVGDVPHQVKRLSTDLVEGHPSLALFRGTIGMSLLLTIAEAMPVFASRLLFTDPAPALASAGRSTP